MFCFLFWNPKWIPFVQQEFSVEVTSSDISETSASPEILLDKRVWQTKMIFFRQMIHPGKSTWNLKITHLQRKII